MWSLVAGPNVRPNETSASTSAAFQRLGLITRSFESGRRELSLDLGGFGIATVLQSPGSCLTNSEWRNIVNARQSYHRMWGGDEHFKSIKEDPFDGRDQSSASYHTTHYIGSIATPGKPDKVLTLRKVALNPDALGHQDGPPLPEDLTFWKVRDRQPGMDTPLADWVKAHLEKDLGLGPYPSVAHLPVAALSRTGTLPNEQAGSRHLDDRNRTAAVYALMQVAVARHDIDNVLYAAQPCEEFRTKAFALQLHNGARMEPHYLPAVETLLLSCQRYRIVLDRSNVAVQRMMFSFPGFWLDNSSLAAALVTLVREGMLTTECVRRAATCLYRSGDVQFLTDEDALLVGALADGVQLATHDVESIAALLARPRFAKYCTDFIRHNMDVSRRILAEVSDGPYAALFRPADLLASSLHMLSVAAEMYRQPARRSATPDPGQPAAGRRVRGQHLTQEAIA
jgi:hypothetical protein